MPEPQRLQKRSTVRWTSNTATGLTYPGLFALMWQSHANLCGTSREDVSAVVNRSNGMKNPLASIGGVITDNEIESSL